MFRDFLWFLGAKQQYEMQRSQGMSGLLAILGVIFFIWKWEDWFYPLFYKMGLVGLAERTGLIHDLDALTVLNIAAVIFVLCVGICLVLIIGVIIYAILLAIGFSDRGQTFLLILLSPLLIIPFFIFRRGKVKSVYSRDKELRSLFKKYQHLPGTEMALKLYIHQCERTDKTFTSTKMEHWQQENAEKYLNRVLPSIKDDTQWLVGYHKEKEQLYILFPNPVPYFGSRSIDSNFRGNGMYGFLSQDLKHTSWAVCDDIMHPNFYVATLSFKILWNRTEKKFVLNHTLDDKIEVLNIYDSMDIYLLKGAEIQTFYNHILNSNTKLQEVLHRAHIAYYLLPIVYEKDERVNGLHQRIFFERCKTVPNGDVFAPIYAADVQAKIIEHAKNGESWAVKWFNGVN